MSKAYFISGLGADWRMFQYLKLPDYISQQNVEWVEPRHIDEPLHEYVHRLLDQISEPDPILVGMSYGGLVAIELSKILKPRKTILISSLATHHALPFIYRKIGKTHLHRWMPLKLMQSVYPLAPLFFGAHTPQEKGLLKGAILHINEKVLRWSLGQLLVWPQEEVLPGLVQIHGTQDRILPLHDRPDIIKVKNGGHLMVLHQADEISAILSKILEETWIKADTSLPPPTESR
ncbi:alpha/beta hydrolase [Pontibacter anaerobius]|uniref:Alpha/beta hydrolase n=1 Tax=Pontibacter anaerobius TaxID=2993940 RepID=A0ABT3RFN4_9BACT|nr:alpha/beta hydrolase [Pontibacter anaerobius]MCX2740050.1 alpha/beta hydrolase [Pontibacter anaerobius]